MAFPEYCYVTKDPERPLYWLAYVQSAGGQVVERRFLRKSSAVDFACRSRIDLGVKVPISCHKQPFED